MDSNLVIGVMALAAFLTWMTQQRRYMLIGVLASLVWFALAMWLFFASTPILGFSEDYQFLLGGAFFLLMFLPLLLQMDIEVTHERNGRKWREYSSRPEEKESSYESYKKELNRRIGRW